MNQLTYELDLGSRRRTVSVAKCKSVDPTAPPIPRIARLMALSIRMEQLVRTGVVRDYAEAARLGRVTRARMTQITKLLDLAPDIQEQVLFLPPLPRLNERNLRLIVRVTDWPTQRGLFQQLIPSAALDHARMPLHPARQPIAL
jgi:hypothetical protein